MVDCKFDKMIISYESYLFGNRVSDGIKEIHAENQPSFNDETGLWTVECIIGECGMILTSDQDKGEIVMRVDLEADGEEYIIIDEQDEQGILTSAVSVISYECRYPKEFQLITKSVKIEDEDEFNGDFKSRGDLNDGFELFYHTDNSLTGLKTEVSFKSNFERKKFLKLVLKIFNFISKKHNFDHLIKFFESKCNFWNFAVVGGNDRISYIYFGPIQFSSEYQNFQNDRKILEYQN